MPHLHLLSWYHQGTEADARNFFQQLREGCQKGIQFPFDCPYQVGLVHCTARGEEHWCVGVVVTGDAANDSIKQNARLEQWFTWCSADGSLAEKHNEPMLHPSVEGTLQQIYGSTTNV
jgi:hypothetical protein